MIRATKDVNPASVNIDRRLLTVSEVAEATGLSPNAIYRAIDAGELRASKLRGRLRVRLADVDGWIDSNVVRVRTRVATPSIPRRGLRELLNTD